MISYTETFVKPSSKLWNIVDQSSHPKKSTTASNIMDEQLYPKTS